MSTLIAIDPGGKESGFACFTGGVLIEAGLAGESQMEYRIDLGTYYEVVVEKMAVYAPRLYAAKALIDLSILAGRFRPTHMYTYREWAGNLKDTQIFARALARLSEDEKAVLPKRLGKHKDVLAAVGIGLYHLGRLRREKK